MPVPPELYLAYLATIAVFFASPPGPSQALMISSCLSGGLRRSAATVAGDLSANALQMTAAAFGLAALVANSAGALALIKWVGVAYLLWVGVRTFRSRASATGQVAEARLRTLYVRGFVTSGANPKAVFFFAALFPQFIDADAPILPQLAVLGATYLVVDGALLFVWGGVARRALRTLARRPRVLSRVSGGMMIVAAGLLALRAPEPR